MIADVPVPALPDDVAQGLRAQVADAQRRWRAPSVVARVVRRGRSQLDVAVGAADLGPDGLADRPTLLPGPDVQYRMGSITKTFTAVLVLQARDDGLLDLDDRLDAHVAVPAHGAITLRRMLCHLSGLQREPAGEIWESMQGPDPATLLADLPRAEAVLSAQQRWHYSNLAYALLGQVVARVRGAGWAQVLQRRLLDPLALARTSCAPQGPVARGYFVDPHADRLRPEPLFPGQAFGPAADLWSTTADLGRWAAFLAEPDETVLARGTLREMAHLHAMADLQRWTLGWGLGLMLHRRAERMYLGHDGAMPGFLASLVAEPRSGVAVVVLTNTSHGADAGGLALALADAVLDQVPDRRPPWRPGAAVPADVERLLGIWWTEGAQVTAVWRAGDDPLLDGADGGHLELALAGAPDAPPSVLRRAGTDRFRVVSGREQGELLRVVRDADPAGAVRRMYWATYPMTRDPLPFGH